MASKRVITVGYISRAVVIAINDNLGLTDNNTATPTRGGGTVGGWIYGANGTYKPSATTSGVPSGTTLTAHSGSYTITTSGTLISAMDISGGIDIKTSNVTISKCHVRQPSSGSGGSSVVDCRWTTCVNALVTDCELAPDTPATSLNSAMGHNVTWQRCYMHRGTDGIRSSTNNHDGGNIGSSANVFLLGNYTGNLAGWLSDPGQSGGPSHNDPWQPEGGNYATAIGNNFYGYVDPTIANGATWNGGNHPSSGSLATNSANQFNTNTTTTVTTGLIVNNNWYGGGYIALNAALGSANHFDSIQNNLFDHGTTSGVQINLVGTTVGTLSGNAFENHVGSITVHS